MIQLHKQVQRWRRDSMLQRTNVIFWFDEYLKMLYLVSVICGSSFSAIALFNSFLLRLDVFGMGLSQYHRRQFQTKRFFSIVLFEAK